MHQVEREAPDWGRVPDRGRVAPHATLIRLQKLQIGCGNYLQADRDRLGAADPVRACCRVASAHNGGFERPRSPFRCLRHWQEGPVRPGPRLSKSGDGAGAAGRIGRAIATENGANGADVGVYCRAGLCHFGGFFSIRGTQRNTVRRIGAPRHRGRGAATT